MNRSPQNTQDHSALLAAAFEAERTRLAALIEADEPQGDYAHPVFGVGNSVSPRVILVGEAPGGEEAASGCPFVGKAGRQLDELLKLAGLDRADIYITNVVKYRPVVRSVRTVRNRTPNRKEVAASLPLLQYELETLAPDTVVTLGNTPLYAMLTLGDRPKETVGALHGQATRVEFSGVGCTLFPLYHPASGIYNRALLDVMDADMRALGEHLVKAR